MTTDKLNQKGNIIKYINDEVRRLFLKYHNVHTLIEYLDADIFKLEKVEDHDITFMVKYSKTKIRALSRDYNIINLNTLLVTYAADYVSYVLKNYVTIEEIQNIESKTGMSFKLMHQYIYRENYFQLYPFTGLGNFILKIPQ